MLASDKELLRHIPDEISFVLRYTNEVEKDVFLEDEVLQRAVVCSLEIIGEATKKLNDEFKAMYPFIEWKKMAGTRDKLIQDYLGVDYDIVWNIIKENLPPLQEGVHQIMAG